ncbi:MAG: DUF2914 domain-containing protein [Desulfobacterales bacterium]|jgi:hypothetical protein|nr:DUF2914 domain-containing protein [Desulfobacterales bacterium]
MTAGLAWAAAGHAQGQARSAPLNPDAKLVLVQALVSEDIKEGIPQAASLAFSISAGKVYCYTLFDGISDDTLIYHHWIFRDRPSARIRLTLRAPRWATYSSIQLREADRGPWRVEIVDAGGRILKTLRFSVTD